MQLRKVRYIFEGLGHLAASIFIHSSQHITKMNDNGKKRMCRNIFTLQQCISGITHNRESDLDRARTFYELLDRSPDDILGGIVERGAVFTEIEYTFLLSLAIRSHPILSAEQGALEQRITQLRQVMAQIG
jgi:exocyst complex component 4